MSTTPTPSSRPGSLQRFSRETQTVSTRQHHVQTEQDSFTQTPCPSLPVTDPLNYVKVAKPYEPSEAYCERQEAAVTTIQRYYRGYLSRKLFRVLNEVVRKRQERIDCDKRLQDDLSKTKLEKILKRKLNPKTASDFELLRDEVKDWLEKETQLIKNNDKLTNTEKKTKIKQLSMQEIKFFQNIEKLKVKAFKECELSKVDKILKKLTCPHSMPLSSGNKFGPSIEVVTPPIQKSIDLCNWFKKLSDRVESVDQRLELLLDVKTLITDFPCNLTYEMSELIDREADLLNRDRPGRSLTGLRSRISELFLLLIQIPQFNPVAGSLNGDVTFVVDEEERIECQSRCSIGLEVDLM
ncbi:hypothetical protein GEMRC1_007232 [Eukaryota sp. GEM-RC1]